MYSVYTVYICIVYSVQCTLRLNGSYMSIKVYFCYVIIVKTFTFATIKYTMMNKCLTLKCTLYTRVYIYIHIYIYIYIYIYTIYIYNIQCIVYLVYFECTINSV